MTTTQVSCTRPQTSGRPRAWRYIGLGSLCGLVWAAASPAAVLQARIQVAFLVLAAASFGIFLVRRRHLRQLRPWR